MIVRLGCSPDPGDALMLWGLQSGVVDPHDYEFEPVVRDVQTLNEWALEGRLEVTVMSLATYPRVQDQYVLLPWGASMGSGSGPVVVARERLGHDALREVEILVAGRLTTGYLVLKMALGDVATRVVPLGRILDELDSGSAQAGLLLHRADADLEVCLDLGEWWLLETGLPLPLRVHAIRRDVAAGVRRVLHDSVDAVLARRTDAPFTADYGEEGRQAVRELLARAEAAGAYDHPVRVEFAE
jgi:1,4-dihydroxy-6-naphthoate synthase